MSASSLHRESTDSLIIWKRKIFWLGQLSESIITPTHALCVALSRQNACTKEWGNLAFFSAERHEVPFHTIS